MSRRIIQHAIRILEQQARYNPLAINSPEDTKKYLRLQLADKESEVFAIMFLNNQHHLIEYEEMFHGTIDQASVYPREIVKRCLHYNAAAIIVAHNHPSGVTEPSESDKKITQRIKAACELVDVRLLDHVIVTLKQATSLAEGGLL